LRSPTILKKFSNLSLNPPSNKAFKRPDYGCKREACWATKKKKTKKTKMLGHPKRMSQLELSY
jgi:hypothetical protein